MIDFSTLQGLTIPEGVVTQIADASGRVLWSAVRTSGNVILEVEKITSNTYASSTTYPSEEFIMLDIYPKSGGTVSVTYGGLTKTVTDTSGAAEPNAQQVYFGTFNGVADSVATPASGTLTIEGDYRGFGVGAYSMAKLNTSYCSCVTKVSDFGTVEIVPINAFRDCTGLTSVTIPSSVTSIGSLAFYGCTGLTSIIVDSGNEYYFATGGILFNKDKTEICAYPTATAHYTIPNSVTSIGGGAFGACAGLTSVTIPSSVTSIGNGAFRDCTGLTSVTIPSGVTSIGDFAFNLESGNTRTVTMLSATPATLGGPHTFGIAGTNNIVVPAGSGDTYKTAEYWSEYANYIVDGTITFIIDGREHTAEEGMTWAEWVESDYNTVDLVITSDGLIRVSETNTGYLQEALATDVIVADKTYVWTAAGGGND